MKRIALFGCGKQGQRLAGEVERMLARNRSFEVIACVDPHAEQRVRVMTELSSPSVAEYVSLDAFLGEGQPYDAAIIATPPSSHYDIAAKVLDAGKDVYVEKPFTVSATDAERLVQKAREKNAVITVGTNRNFFPEYRAVSQLVRQKRIGDMRAFFYYTTFPWQKDTRDSAWRRNNIFPGSGMHNDHSPHVLSYLIQELGFKPKEAHYLSSKMSEGGADVGICYRLIDATHNPAVILMDGTAQEQRKEQLHIYGSFGVIRISFDNGVTKVYLDEELSTIPQANTTTRDSSRFGPLHQFIAQVTGDAPRTLPDEGLVLPVKVTEGIHHARRGMHHSVFGEVYYPEGLADEMRGMSIPGLDPFASSYVSVRI